MQVRCGAWSLPARAEIVDHPERKRELVSRHPSFPPAPFPVVHAVVRTLLRPLLVGGEG